MPSSNPPLVRLQDDVPPVPARVSPRQEAARPAAALRSAAPRRTAVSLPPSRVTAWLARLKREIAKQQNQADRPEHEH